MFEPLNEEPELSTTVTFMLTVWVILLVLGAPIALMGTGMAFEGGPTVDAYMFLIAAWSYPPLVAAAFFCRRRNPALVWLPLFTLLLLVIEELASQILLSVRFD